MENRKLSVASGDGKERTAAAVSDSSPATAVGSISSPSSAAVSNGIRVSAISTTPAPPLPSPAGAGGSDGQNAVSSSIVVVESSPGAAASTPSTGVKGATSGVSGDLASQKTASTPLSSLDTSVPSASLSVGGVDSAKSASDLSGAASPGPGKFFSQIGERIAGNPDKKPGDSAVDELVFSLKKDDYELGKIIGFGSSGQVYVATYKPLRLRVAVKSIDLEQFERNQIDELRKELQVMSLCKHPNVLTVKGSFVVESKLYIIEPFLSAGSCLDIMKTSFPDGLDEISIGSILKQALLGLEYLHRNNLIHRDVKAGNLLMDEDGTVKLADFGVSSSLIESDRNGVRKTFVGTPCWIAPEVVQQVGHNAKADIWSFGITALELAHGRAPFAKYPPMKVLLMTLQNEPPTLDRNNAKRKFTKVFKEMIDSCLQKDPVKRPTSEKLLQHPFFKATKKKNVLVDSIVKKVPSVTERPHKEPTIKEKSITIEEGWDFDSLPPSLADEEIKSGGQSNHASDDDLAQSSPAALEMGNSKKDGISSPTLSASAGSPTLGPSVQQQKKGRFTVDVAVASPADGSVPQTGATPQATPQNAPPEQKPQVKTASQPPPTESAQGSEVRKGRFQVIGEPQPSAAQSVPASPLMQEDQEKSARFETRQRSIDDQPPTAGAKIMEKRSSVPNASVASTAVSPAADSLRKGRFEVTSTTAHSSPSDSSTSAPELPPASNGQLLAPVQPAIGKGLANIPEKTISPPESRLPLSRSVSNQSLDTTTALSNHLSAISLIVQRLQGENSKLREENAALREQIKRMSTSS